MPSLPNKHSVTSETRSCEQPSDTQRRRWTTAGVVVVLGSTLGIAMLWLVFRRGPETARGPAIAVTAEDAGDPMLEVQVASIQAGDSTRLQFLDSTISDRALRELPVESLTSLDSVIVDQGVVTDEGLAVIARLPGLEQLRLRNSPISDVGMASLGVCKRLWLVNLPQSRITSAGLASLQKLTSLKQLRIGSPLLGDDCCRVIAQLTSLRGLHLIGVPVTDEGLQVLATLPHLESLYLDDSKVSEAGWDWLFEHDPQLHVHVNQQHHDRDPHTHPH